MSFRFIYTDQSVCLKWEAFGGRRSEIELAIPLNIGYFRSVYCLDTLGGSIQFCLNFGSGVPWF